MKQAKTQSVETGTTGEFQLVTALFDEENMSMQAIAWLELHPQRMDEVRHYNKSFALFRLNIVCKK